MAHKENTSNYNPRRALAKTGFIIVTAILIIAALAYFVNEQALDELKHNLSLWSLIALVIIINLVSFICFIVLYAAYRWVKGDLKAPEKADY